MQDDAVVLGLHLDPIDIGHIQFARLLQGGNGIHVAGLFGPALGAIGGPEQVTVDATEKQADGVADAFGERRPAGRFDLRDALAVGNRQGPGHGVEDRQGIAGAGFVETDAQPGGGDPCDPADHRGFRADTAAAAAETDLHGVADDGGADAEAFGLVQVDEQATLAEVEDFAGSLAAGVQIDGRRLQNRDAGVAAAVPGGRRERR